MQAVLDVHALKIFTKTLICLAKYGDDLTLHASPDTLSLSATNSSKSAYCRFRLAKTFFSRYHLDISPNAESDGSVVADDVVGQVLTKSLLSILKHKTLDKSVERCELYICDGAARSSHAAETNGIENKLIIRMHCKHGVVKTHRLLLMFHGTLLAPSVLDRSDESRIIIGSRMLREMIEHFPPAKGKSDPRLVWSFGATEVGVKSLDAGVDSKGKAQISTELTVNANEFDDYYIYDPPIMIAFHLREFSATIAYADSMGLSLVIRFTDPAAPLYIDIDGENDCAETLFVISTSQVHGAPARTSTPANRTTGSSKRSREERTATPAPSKKLVRAVYPIDTSLNASDDRMRAQSRPTASPVPPPSFSGEARIPSQTSHSLLRELDNREPLFLPPSPHIHDVGCEGLPLPSAAINPLDVAASSTGLRDVEMELEATQNGSERINFQPLFED